MATQAKHRLDSQCSTEPWHMAHFLAGTRFWHRYGSRFGGQKVPNISILMHLEMIFCWEPYHFAFFWCISCIFNPSLLYKLFFSNILTIADMETHSKINTLNTPWVHLKRVPPMHRKNLSFWNSPNLSISVSVDERYGEFSQFLAKKVPNI